MNPLHAAYYPDRAAQHAVEVTENVRLARDTYRLRFTCPELARRFVPGQFLMLRLAGFDDPLIGRPLALYDTVVDGQDRPVGVDVVYLVKGKLTTRLARLKPGQMLDVWGPLGNGFPPQPVEHLVMVAGGIGQTPFVALAREFLGLRRYGDPQRTVEPSRRVTLCYGARSADYLAGVEDFERLGVDVQLATDDGSRGHHGFVTDVLRDLLGPNSGDRRPTNGESLPREGESLPREGESLPREGGSLPGEGEAPAEPATTMDDRLNSCESSYRSRIVCCGPEAMMEAVARVAHARHVPCQVSLETPMACGIGICFTCVAKVRDASGDWDYKRTCVDGPVFDAAAIEW